MRNKRGDGYITTCVMVVIICMLVVQTMYMRFGSVLQIKNLHK